MSIISHYNNKVTFLFSAEIVVNEKMHECMYFLIIAI